MNEGIPLQNGIVFYLKINRSETENLNIFWHWVKIVDAIGADYFVLVDSESVRTSIEQLYIENGYTTQPKFITSYRDKLCKICEGLFDDYWLNVAYSHLTPIIHAIENNFGCFWGIDADDTVLCASPHDCCLLLEEARQFALNNQINLFSLDMCYSRRLPQHYHWSFGVAFTNMNVDYLKVLEKGKCLLGGKPISEMANMYPVLNVDSYFSFLSDQGYLLCKSFYCEGLFFDHHKTYLIKYKEKSIEFLYGSLDILQMTQIRSSEIPIGTDSVKLDISLSEFQSSLKIREEILDYPEVELVKMYEKVVNEGFKQRIGTDIESLKKRDTDIILFGCGDDGRRALDILRILELKVRCFCDSNPLIWGQSIDGVDVISPKELQKKRGITVIITSSKYHNEIRAQLDDMGIVAVNGNSREG